MEIKMLSDEFDRLMGHVKNGEWTVVVAAGRCIGAAVGAPGEEFDPVLDRALHELRQARREAIGLVAA